MAGAYSSGPVPGRQNRGTRGVEQGCTAYGAEDAMYRLPCRGTQKIGAV